jgi:hypothetical protein
MLYRGEISEARDGRAADAQQCLSAGMGLPDSASAGVMSENAALHAIIANNDPSQGD